MSVVDGDVERVHRSEPYSVFFSLSCYVLFKLIKCLSVKEILSVTVAISQEKKLVKSVQVKIHLH